MKKLRLILLFALMVCGTLYGPKPIDHNPSTTVGRFSSLDFIEIARRERTVKCTLKTKDYFEKVYSRSLEEVLQQQQKAQKELNDLREIDADSFVIWFLKENPLVLSDSFHQFARPENYHDVIKLIIFACNWRHDEGLKESLLRYICQDDSRCSSDVFDWYRYLDGISQTIKRKVSENQELCNRIDDLWVAQGRSPLSCLVFKGLQDAYQDYLANKKSKFSSKIKALQCSIL